MWSPNKKSSSETRANTASLNTNHTPNHLVNFDGMEPVESRISLHGGQGTNDNCVPQLTHLLHGHLGGGMGHTQVDEFQPLVHVDFMGEKACGSVLAEIRSIKILEFF